MEFVISLSIASLIALPFIISLVFSSRNPITERIAPYVTIEASVDKFIFQTERSQLEIEPYLYVNAKQQVVEIGKVVLDDQDLDKIELFKPDGYFKQDHYKAMALEAFLHFGIDNVTQNYPGFIWGVKPIVKFKGLETFDSVMAGYHRYVFENLP